MTAKIKLNAASGGGSFSLQAPSSSANTRVMTLPDTADGTILTTTNPKAGNILQVVQTVKTDTTTYSSVASGAFTADVMTAAITPASTSNKILVTCTICMQVSTTDAGFKLNRGGTDICVGDTSGNRRPVTVAATDSGVDQMFNLYAEFLDSPNTTSATTYGVKVTHGSSGSVDIFINQMNSGNDAKIMRPTSSLTLKEVAA